MASPLLPCFVAPRFTSKRILLPKGKENIVVVNFVHSFIFIIGSMHGICFAKSQHVTALKYFTSIVLADRDSGQSCMHGSRGPAVGTIYS